MLVIGKTIIPDNISFFDLEIFFLEEKFREDFFFEENKGVFFLKNEKVKIVDRLVYQKNEHVFPVVNWKDLEIDQAN